MNIEEVKKQLLKNLEPDWHTVLRHGIACAELLNDLCLADGREVPGELAEAALEELIAQGKVGEYENGTCFSAEVAELFWNAFKDRFGWERQKAEKDAAAERREALAMAEKAKMTENNRHPHKEILHILGKVDCEDEAQGVLVRAEVLELCLDGFEREQINAALLELQGEGAIVGKRDPNGTSFALARYEELIKAEEAEYTALKTRVYAAAQRAGLWLKWKPSEGWHFINVPGGVAVRGNMRVLEAYLSGLAGTPA